MMKQDPSLERVSACPVHFLWDGRGAGRVWVRLGGMGLVAAGALFAATRVFPLAPGLTTTSRVCWRPRSGCGRSVRG